MSMLLKLVLVAQLAIVNCVQTIFAASAFLDPSSIRPCKHVMPALQIVRNAQVKTFARVVLLDSTDIRLKIAQTLISNYVEVHTHQAFYHMFHHYII